MVDSVLIAELAALAFAAHQLVQARAAVSPGTCFFSCCSGVHQFGCAASSALQSVIKEQQMYCLAPFFWHPPTVTDYIQHCSNAHITFLFF
jgi:hypothetical protein